MFRNLDAEQSRYGFTNSDMADKLEISRRSYEMKKKNGMFKLSEIVFLLKLFKCNFEYLFEENKIIT